MKQPLILTLLMMASICTSMAQQMDRPNMKPTSFIQQESSDSSIEQPCLIDRDLPAQQTAASSVTESLGMGLSATLDSPVQSNFSKTCALMLLSTLLWQSATSIQKKQSQAILNNLSHKKEIQNPYQPFQKTRRERTDQTCTLERRALGRYRHSLQWHGYQFGEFLASGRC